MYYISTILIGWVMLNFAINLLSALIGFSLNNYILVYIIIGYVVMSIKKVPSPLNNYEPLSPDNSPMHKMKSIQLNLFFKEIYYTLWWPYYILHK